MLVDFFLLFCWIKLNVSIVTSNNHTVQSDFSNASKVTRIHKLATFVLCTYLTLACHTERKYITQAFFSNKCVFFKKALSIMLFRFVQVKELYNIARTSILFRGLLKREKNRYLYKVYLYVKYFLHTCF